MKKFYTLALAVAVAVSASAAGRQTAISFSRPQMKVNAESFGKYNLATETVKKAPAKAAAIADYEGEYLWSYYGLLEGDSGESSASLHITITDAATGAAEISGWPQGFIVKATFDLAAGTLTIPNKQDLGKDSSGDQNYFYIKGFNTDGTDIADGASSVAASVGVIDGFAITFPEDDIWAIGDPDNESLGWWKLTYVNKFELDKWTLLGTGSFIENIIYGAFMAKENTTACDVELYCRDETLSEIKIMDPFHVLYAENDIDAESPAMILDANDPDNVLVAATATGLGNQTEGSYICFSLSWYDETAATADQRIKLVKDGDNVTVTFPVKSMGIFASATQEIYYAAPYVSTLTFKAAGISDVAIDNAQGEVEFFNLQGVRVANPENGIFIRRQGNTATKVFVK